MHYGQTLCVYALPLNEYGLIVEKVVGLHWQLTNTVAGTFMYIYCG